MCKILREIDWLIDWFFLSHHLHTILLHHSSSSSSNLEIFCNANATTREEEGYPKKISFLIKTQYQTLRPHLTKLSFDNKTQYIYFWKWVKVRVSKTNQLGFFVFNIALLIYSKPCLYKGYKLLLYKIINKYVRLVG